MAGTGATVVKPGGSASIEGDSMFLAERTFINEGVFTLDSGYLSLSKNARFKNTGTFDANVQGTFGIAAEASDLSGLFINTGTFQKTEGTGETRIEVDFENDGKVEAQTGKFTFGFNKIVVTLATGSSLAGEILLNTGEMVGGSFKASDLTIEHSSLAVSPGATASIADLTMNYESLVTGAGTLDLTGTFLWNLQSTMSGSGATVITHGATGSIAAETMKLTERALVNEGTFTWDAGSLTMGNGAKLENIGTFNANSQEAGIYVLESEREDPQPLFINAGKFQKTEGAGETKVEAPFENQGVLVQSAGKVFIKTPVTRESSTQYGGENPSTPGQEPPQLR